MTAAAKLLHLAPVDRLPPPSLPGLPVASGARTSTSKLYAAALQPSAVAAGSAAGVAPAVAAAAASLAAAATRGVGGPSFAAAAAAAAAGAAAVANGALASHAGALARGMPPMTGLAAAWPHTGAAGGPSGTDGAAVAAAAAAAAHYEQLIAAQHAASYAHHHAAALELSGQLAGSMARSFSHAGGPAGQGTAASNAPWLAAPVGGATANGAAAVAAAAAAAAAAATAAAQQQRSNGDGGVYGQHSTGAHSGLYSMASFGDALPMAGNGLSSGHLSGAQQQQQQQQSNGHGYAPGNSDMLLFQRANSNGHAYDDAAGHHYPGSLRNGYSNGVHVHAPATSNSGTHHQVDAAYTHAAHLNGGLGHSQWAQYSQQPPAKGDAHAAAFLLHGANNGFVSHAAPAAQMAGGDASGVLLGGASKMYTLF